MSQNFKLFKKKYRKFQNLYKIQSQHLVKTIEKPLKQTIYSHHQSLIFVKNMLEQKKNEEFKKQALQFILSIYLQRQNDEDIQFIQENVTSTSQFALNVSSSIKVGLNEENIQKNRFMYGKNSKRIIKKFNLKDVVLRVFRINHALIMFISIIQVVFGTLLGNRQIYMDAVYALVLLCFVLLIRIVTIYLNEKKKSQQSYDKNKNQKYRVLRDGNFAELLETKIVVGDIIELDYKEKAPASGLLITSQEIAMNQEKYGKKLQRKMCLEKCISYISKLTLLELKIDAEKQTLPSPIILRGTQQVYGSSYRMLVLAVDQQNLLDKHKIPDDSTFASDVIRDWFQTFQQKVSKIMRVISVIYLILFLSLFSLKEYLQRRHLTGEVFFQDLFSVLLMSIISFNVFDTNCLRLFFQTQVINYTQNLNDPKQVDKYLTVEQIYITENNIVKYDQIVVCQIGLPDKQTVVSYEDLSLLPSNTQAKIDEVLHGVGLKPKKILSENNNIKQDILSMDFQNRLNQIIHLNTVDQKIFSSLYNKYQSNGNDEAQIQTPMFVMNNIQEENVSNISLNRVTPLQGEQIFSKIKRSNFKKKQSSLQKRGQGLKQVNQQTLKGYLSEFCKFKTQNIVQSIVQLAKKQSKTYYYQKYTLSRVKKIPYLYVNGSSLEMSKERIQKTKRMARNIRVNQNLTPFLIGYSEGAYNNNSMMVLVAIVGARMNYQNQIIQRLQQLTSLGINASVLIHKRQDDQKDSKQNILLQSKMTSDIHQEEDYNKIILAEYVNRGWISHQTQEMIDFLSLKQSGGVVRCQNCYLSKCDCKDRIQQLSNIQGFMSSVQNTKIIHSIQGESDINYLKVGSQQVRNSVLLITKYKSDTIKILEDIKKGYYLSNTLEKGLNVWFGFMFVSAVCFYPLSLISFGGVFCSGDLSLWTLFIQSLPVIGNLELSIKEKQKVENSSRRNKVLYSKRSTMSVFLLCLLSTIIATMFYVHPELIIQESFDHIAHKIESQTNLNFHRDCNYKFSIFLNDDFNKIECIPPKNQTNVSTQKLPQYIYTQNVNFIFSYSCLNMFFFLMINFRNFTKIKILLVYASFFGVYFLVIYALPDIIHGRYDGLTPGQLAIVFSMSILTNLVVQCIVYFSNYNCSLCQTEEFQSILAFQNHIQDHYSTKLKKYSSFQTEIYTLN